MLIQLRFFNRSAKQGDELHDFYNMCKHHGIARSSEYPTVEKVSQEHLDSLEDYLRSNAPSRSKGSKSPEPQPLQIEYRPQTPSPEPEPKTLPVTPEPPPVVETPREATYVEPEPPREPERGIIVFPESRLI